MHPNVHFRAPLQEARRIDPTPIMAPDKSQSNNRSSCLTNGNRTLLAEGQERVGISEGAKLRIMHAWLRFLPKTARPLAGSEVGLALSSWQHPRMSSAGVPRSESRHGGIGFSRPEMATKAFVQRFSSPLEGGREAQTAKDVVLNSIPGNPSDQVRGVATERKGVADSR